MFFNDDNELDYGEDELDDKEEAKSLLSKNDSENFLDEEINSNGCDDQCLEINLGEDETQISNLSTVETQMDTENEESKPIQPSPPVKVPDQSQEKKEIVLEDKQFTRKWRVTPRKQNGEGRPWRKPFSKPRNKNRPFGSNSRPMKLSYGNTTNGVMIPTYQRLNNQQLSKKQLSSLFSSLDQSFQSQQQQSLPHLNGTPIRNAFMGSRMFYSNLMVAGNHQWFSPLSAVQTRLPFNQILSQTNYRGGNSGSLMKNSPMAGMPLQMNFERNNYFGSSSDAKNGPNLLLGRGETRSIVATGNSFKSNIKLTNFRKNSNFSPNSVPSEFGGNKPVLPGTSAVVGNDNGLVSHIGRSNFLQEDEKEMMKVRKEARLRRFENDEEIYGKKKEIFSCFEKTSDRDLVFGDDYYKKLEEQKQKREKIFSLKEELRTNQNPKLHLGDFAVQSKLSIDIESLMKKKNPFEISDQVVERKIKEERKEEEEGEKEKMRKEEEEVKGRNRHSEWMPGLRDQKQVNLFVNPKNEVNCRGDNVTFVRTVSKTFEELCLQKGRQSGCSAVPEGRLPMATSSHLTRSITLEEKEVDREEKPSIKEGSLLLGCIVKVLNIPESATTTDVLALCKPVGKAVEVKLNSPKENSAVIRFETPGEAEKFYSLYHGHKMQKYFLNVIII